ncbi:MAG: helix-turn-helix transcriptional regulator, partial [Lachnospiraceae bacterium]|nr:helix-turn-helix transcriptional regulator [Lachnospiraceae bacterium]
RLFSEEPCHYVIINAYIGNDDELQLCSFIPKCVNSNTIFLLETLVRDFGTVSSKKTEKCETLLAYLYYQLLERSCEGENPHIQHIKQYITDNISKGLSLNDIASSVHLAPQYACLLFKKHTGITITQFIINQRIDLAKRLIITEDNTLYKIAELCGFHDYNYFSKTFKKVTGLSAAQYRKTKYENI